MISNKIFKILKRCDYLEKHFHLSVDRGSYDLIKIIDYKKSKKTEAPIKETLEYINILDKHHDTLVRVRYLEKEIIRKGVIEVEYYNMYTSDLINKNEVSIFIAQ